MDATKLNQIWVPGTTEIYTEDGWISVKNAFKKMPKIMTACRDKRKVGLQQSKGWAERPYEGKINRMVEGLLRMEFQSAFPIDKSEILNIGGESAPAVYKQVDYKGFLYSFHCDKGVAMLRCQFQADEFTERSLDEIEAYDRENYEDKMNDPEYQTGEISGVPDWWMSRTRW